MKSITEVVQNLLKPYIDTKIQTLTNLIKEKRVVILGDSFSRSGYVTAGEEWFSLLSNDGYIIHNYAVGGAGFVQHQTGSVYISDEITSAAAGVPNVNDIDFVILFAGLNDYNLNVTPADIKTSAISAIQSIKSNFPNAQILYLPLNYGYSTPVLYAHMRFLSAMIEAGLDEGVITFESAPFMFAHKALGALVEGSGHPNTEGNLVIYNIMKRMLAGNTEPITYHMYYTPVTDGGVNFLANSGSDICIKGQYIEFIVRLQVNAGSFNNGDSFNIAKIITLDGDNPVNINVNHPLDYDDYGFDYSTLDCNISINGSDGNLIATFTADRTFSGTSGGNYKFRTSLVRPY